MAGLGDVVFVDRDDDTYYNGKLVGGLYSARFGRRMPHLRGRIADSIRYELIWGRHVVVAAEYAMDDAFRKRHPAKLPVLVSRKPGATVER
jgi:hypothetical protein